ncbi:unnamed protein product [Ascophyllum nodosum]
MILGIRDTVPPMRPQQVFTVVLALLSIFQGVRGESNTVCSTEFPGGTEYMCVDWSVGSARMKAAQGQYSASNGDAVIFGMGSYGSQTDGNMGKCYRFTLDTGAIDIIAQVTNFGADVASNQFDMQMGGGGFGVWNACAGPTDHLQNEASPCEAEETDDIHGPPLYSLGQENWGKRCGGQTSIEGCLHLPDYPTELENVPTEEPTLIELCWIAFEWNVRKAGGNPIITNGHRVPCPDALVEVTTLKRDDDDEEETMASGGILTSTMDCCPPAGSDTYNTDNNRALPEYNRLVPCDQTGYTRSTE